jgi:hypothetical protein
MKKKIKDMFRREKIFGMIRRNPGISGSGIWNGLIADSRLAKRLGEDSLLVALFGVSVASMYPALDVLERHGRIRSEWIEGPYPRRRVYFAELSDSPT